MSPVGRSSSREAVGDCSRAERYCDELSVEGYDDFRVPTLVELLSIFDAHADATGYLRVDEGAFPGERWQWDYYFFSSTTDAETVPWVVDFLNGQALDTLGARRVRCVRTEL